MLKVGWPVRVWLILKLMRILKELWVIQEIHILVVCIYWDFKVLVCSKYFEFFLRLISTFCPLFIEILMSHLRSIHRIYLLLLLLDLLSLAPLFPILLVRYLILSSSLGWSLLLLLLLLDWCFRWDWLHWLCFFFLLSSLLLHELLKELWILDFIKVGCSKTSSNW